LAEFLQSCSRTFFDSFLLRSVAIVTGFLYLLWFGSMCSELSLVLHVRKFIAFIVFAVVIAYVDGLLSF